MSSKVINVMRQIVAKPELIQDTYMLDSEVFFRFNNFYFSTLRSQSRDPEVGPYSFYVYPKWQGSLLSLAHSSESDSGNVPMVSYNSGEFELDDEKALFRELHTLMTNKHLNVDSIFDNILATK